MAKARPRKTKGTINFDVPFATSLHTNYLYKSDHRNGGNPLKSQWVIDLAAELSCFEGAHSAGWIDDTVAWGLRIIGGVPSVVGTSIRGVPLKLAKFVETKQPQYWHGYPADYRQNAQDRPSVEILLKWVTLAYIGKHEAVRVRTQKRCSLSG
jgi:hypothetical protein